MRRSTVRAALVVGLASSLVALAAPAAHAAPIETGPACSTHAGDLTPVICVPDEFQEGEQAPLADDNPVTFAAQVVNNGPNVDNASVVLTLPDTLKVAPGTTVERIDDWWTEEGSEDDPTPLDCVTSGGGRTVTCATGALASEANALIVISLLPTAKRTVGASATFSIALQPAADATPFPSTSVSASVEFTGVAKLEVSVTPGSAKVVVGKTATLTATVHNAGPNPAPDALLIAFSATTQNRDGESHFVITNSEDLSEPDSDSASSAPASSTSLSPEPPATTTAARTSTAAAQATVRAARSASSSGIRFHAGDPTVDASDSSDSPFGIWSLGTLAAGKSADTEIVVKAVSVGVDSMSVLAASTAGTACAAADQGDITDCSFFASAQLTAIAVPTAPTPTVTVTSTVTRSATASSASTTVTVSTSVHSDTTSTDARSPAVSSTVAGTVLANTGTSARPLVGWGVLSLLAGGVLMVLGRRPTRRGAHR